MGPISGLISTTTPSATVLDDAASPSLGARLGAAVASAVTTFRRAAADRRLREQLADMDDSLLRDIGIAEDEIYRVRNRERFTPRAWIDQVEIRSGAWPR